MPRVRVVTDSGCDIPASLLHRLGIIVVPFSISIGDRTYQDRVSLTPDQFYKRLTAGKQPVTLQAPSPSDFYSVYTSLGRTSPAIISIHSSSKISDAYASAMIARDLLSSNLRVTVVDSQSVSMGLGFIVLAAAEAAQRGESLDDVVSLVRGMVLQTHVMFALESTAYLDRSPRFAKLKAAIGDATDSRPLIQLEEGLFEVAERVRTKAKVTERLYEFVELFPQLQELAVLYGKVHEDADPLIRRVDAVFAKEPVVVAQYGPVLGTFFGPGAIGVAAYEGSETW